MTAMHVLKKRSHADKSLEILNKQDSAIKYIVEFEDRKHSLNFLDINITNNTSSKKDKFKVHRKDTITSITKRIFKGVLHRAHTLCSEKYIKEEIQFLVDMLVENGHERTFLENLV